MYSAGEFIYTDYIFDAHGADDGGDAERAQRSGPLFETVPETARVEHLSQQAFGDAGVSALEAAEQYGDAGYREAADLLEFRVAADRRNVYFLARTTTMRSSRDAAVLVLADLGGSRRTHAVPFSSGIRTAASDVALFLADGAGRTVDLRRGLTSPLAVRADPAGYGNAIEAVVPRSLVERNGRLKLSVATGLFDPKTSAFADLEQAGPNLVNVAFRTAEPVRTWMDRSQALALGRGLIDDFAVSIDTRKLLAGATETWRPGRGYHERIFRSTSRISTERGLDGVHQHYGLFVASRPQRRVPLTFWMHWRGGKTHSAATIAPRIMRDHGGLRGGIVVAPRGRGTNTWYLGKGLVDFNEVWRDVFRLFDVDRDRVYVTGHSMGGWASYLLSTLYPDRWAGAFPVAGPVTQGAWTGLDFSGCDDYSYDSGDTYTFCYVATDDGDPRAQHTRRMLENLRNVPIAIYQGGADELVPTSGVTRQVERLVELGYRHRYYLFPTYEHYSHPLVDEWAEGVRYLALQRERNPPRVTYVRDMPFERSVERGPSQFSSPETDLSFDFDSAYWMSGLTPADAHNGVARFDGISLARSTRGVTTVPEAGGPAGLGQAGPYTMTGLAWLESGDAPGGRNAFEAALQGTSAVQLNLRRMGISARTPITARVTTDHPLTLRLKADWARVPRVTVNGRRSMAAAVDGVLVIELSRGLSAIAIR